ncbi:DUF871 domain-containing protein [Sporolactobacillus terrae]|uniref:DUF871 domain-containing protein n=1 Tax=Sporolactobacillus terrae TaxID=269673 RepID=UPI00048CDDAD|nr:MupG family TIM beta-alpha barrel fold protein [Sporolactobacillus terrae]
MYKKGISIYPEHSTPEKDMAYLSMAAGFGYQRVFTCLLSVQASKLEIEKEFKVILEHANDLGMEVIFDVNPGVLQKLGISYNDLSFFKELGASGIRLDGGFNGLTEAQISYNRFGLKVEINMSNGTKMIDNIMSFSPDREHLIGCHNFYPQRYTGLSEKHYIECSKKFKKCGLRTAAFVTSNTATMGPWKIMEGLPTLEEHRGLPIDVQAKHLYALGYIDDVLIGNAYASEEELKELAAVSPSYLKYKIKLNEKCSDLEKKIIMEEPHIYRGDVSEYLIRSSQSRVKYRDYPFPLGCTETIKRGDLLIGNDNFGQYKGELQIALKDMENEGQKNIVGHVVEDELFLLDYLAPWSKFGFELA